MHNRNINTTITNNFIRMLTNINYKGHTKESVDHLEFNRGKPRQCVLKYQDYKIIMFPTGNCRIMGCKRIIKEEELPYNIKIEKIQSLSITIDMKEIINLNELAQKIPCIYEPELFPALRLIDFDPLCVNVFQSGKIVVLGIKTLEYDYIIHNIELYVLLMIL